MRTRSLIYVVGVLPGQSVGPTLKNRNLSFTSVAPNAWLLIVPVSDINSAKTSVVDKPEFVVRKMLYEMKAGDLGQGARFPRKIRGFGNNLGPFDLSHVDIDVIG